MLERDSATITVAAMAAFFRRLRVGFCCLLAAIVPIAAAQPTLDPVVAVSLAPIGRHPTSGVDFSSTNVRVFLDLMQHGSEFAVEWGQKKDGSDDGDNASYTVFGPEYTTAHHPTFDANGYPSSGLLNESYFGRDRIITVATTIGAGGANLPAGDYVCLVEGTGVVTIQGDAFPLGGGGSSDDDDVIITVASDTSQPGRAPFELRPAAGLTVRILRSSPVDPVRRVRVVPLDSKIDVLAGNATSGAFRPEFLERLAPFNTLVFHGWLGVDDNDYNEHNLADSRSWASRPTVAQQTQRGDVDGKGRVAFGVALEHVVDLCNLVGADAWLTLPDAEDDDDDFAQRTSAFVAERLAPDRRVLVQHRWGKGFGNFDRQQSQSEIQRRCVAVSCRVSRSNTSGCVSERTPWLGWVGLVCKQSSSSTIGAAFATECDGFLAHHWLNGILVVRSVVRCHASASS